MACLITVDKGDVVDILLDDIEFLHWGRNQELQVKAAKQGQSIIDRLRRTAAKGLVDDDEAIGAVGKGKARHAASGSGQSRLSRGPLIAESLRLGAILVGKRGCEHGVSQLLLLTTRLTARILVVIDLAIILTRVLRGREVVPLLNVDHLAAPPAVDVGAVDLALEAVD